MLKSSFVFLHLVVVGISVWEAYCLTEEQRSEMKDALKPLAMECMEGCGLTEDVIKEEEYEDVDPCFKICLLKKIGMLNEDGKYDRNAVKEHVLTYTDNEEEANTVQSALDDCFKDKEEELENDNEAEVKRAEIIFECFKNFKQ